MGALRMASRGLGEDMTEEQLEKAARKYCELAGLDPDAILLHD